MPRCQIHAEPQCPKLLPDRFRDVEHLEEVMTTPSPELVAELGEDRRRSHHPRRRRQDRADARAARQARGAGQAHRRRRALQREGPAREADRAGHRMHRGRSARPQAGRRAAETAECRLHGRAASSAHPAHEDFTWAMNAHVPALVAEASPARASSPIRPAAFIPMWTCGTAARPRRRRRRRRPASTPIPASRASRCSSISRARAARPGRIIRLNYAIDMRYGVLFDVATRVHAGETDRSHDRACQRDLAGRCQRDGAARARPLHGAVFAAQCQRAGNDQRPLARGSVRRSASARRRCLPARRRRPPGWSTPPRRCRLFGYPRVPLARMIDWTADWVARGLPSLGKDTHFDTRDGDF